MLSFLKKLSLNKVSPMKIFKTASQLQQTSQEMLDLKKKVDSKFQETMDKASLCVKLANERIERNGPKL